MFNNIKSVIFKHNITHKNNKLDYMTTRYVREIQQKSLHILDLIRRSVGEYELGVLGGWGYLF